jgi:hypothetical protein
MSPAHWPFPDKSAPRQDWQHAQFARLERLSRIGNRLFTDLRFRLEKRFSGLARADDPLAIMVAGLTLGKRSVSRPAQAAARVLRSSVAISPRTAHILR